MTKPRFDPLIHAPHRLQLCAILNAVDTVEFSTAREQLDVSDSVLSKQVSALEDAGYLTVKKAARDSRVRTWLSLTKQGRSAYAAHVAELQRIVSGS